MTTHPPPLGRCLHDYNTAIITTSLQIVCVLASESAAAREEMRQEEVLLGVLRIVQVRPPPTRAGAALTTAHHPPAARQAFPAEDVTLGVLDAALEAVSHIVLHSANNQEYTRTTGGIEPIVAALSYCASRHEEKEKEKEKEGAPPSLAGLAVTAPKETPNGRPGSRPTSRPGSAPDRAADFLKVSETASLALSNVVFRAAECQEAALAAGVLPACVQLLDAARPVATHTAVLNLLVNLADTNPAAQDALCSDEAARALLELLGAARSPRVLSGLCLLLSHAVWNHTGNQRRFGEEPTVRSLLAFLAPAGRPKGGEWGFGGGAEGEGEGAGAAQRGELTLTALMALVNLSYCNTRVQELIRTTGGFPLLLAQLSSPIYEVQRTASFCLGNLVKENAPNASEAVAAGALELLLRCLNDDDDDELAKTAYSTICQLGEAGLLKVLALLSDALATLTTPPAAPTPPRSPAEAAEGEGGVPMMGGEGFWGCLYFAVLAPPLGMGSEPSTASGKIWHEDFGDTLLKLRHSSSLLTVVLVYCVFIGTYNWLANIVTLRLNAVVRSILDTLRTLGVWAIDLAIWYGGWRSGGSPGEAWSVWSWLELAGFMLLVYGTLTYKEILQMPCLAASAPKPEEDDDDAASLSARV